MAIRRIIFGGGPKPPYQTRALKSALLMMLVAWIGWRFARLPIVWLLYVVIGIVLVGAVADVIWQIRTGWDRRIQLRR